jgi:redox-sensitive bicupin YhaK (pirin superfamily)
MDQLTYYPADSRGRADHGWLKSFHTFSFAGYHDTERMNFGTLRVLNDDTVEGGMGFGLHPHDNMEIISIPLEGALEHRDSMGNTAVIRKNDIQVMSAGTGIRHSEYNKDRNLPVKFLQIWIFPNERNVSPRYDQITLDPAERHNRLQQVLSPDPDDEGVWIHQDAWFHMGCFDEGIGLTHDIQKSGNGLYAFVLKGAFTIEGMELKERDGLGIRDRPSVSLKANTRDAEILLMEVPMSL